MKALKACFNLPKVQFYGMAYTAQITVYYELGRFIKLLLQSNPTTLELLASPPIACACVRR